MPQTTNNAKMLDYFPLFAFAAFIFVCVIAMGGYSMKWALRSSGAANFGFWASLCLTMLTGLMSGIGSATVTLAVPDAPLAPLYALIASVILACLTISIVTRSGIGRSLVTYIYQGLYSGLLATVLLLITFAGIYAMKDTPLMTNVAQTLKEQAKTNFPTPELASAGKFDVSGELDAQTNAVGFNPSNFFGQVTSNESADKADAWAAPSTTDFRDSFYESDDSYAESSSEPVSRGVQNNPFAR